MNSYDTKYKPSFRICEQISDKVFDVQDSTGKVRHMCVQYLQLLHPTQHVLTHLSDLTSLGWMMRYLNYPNLIPNLDTPVET